MNKEIKHKREINRDLPVGLGMFRFLLTVLCLLISSGIVAQIDSTGYERILTVNDMKNDISYYFKTLKTMNASLYNRYTKSQIDSVRNKLYEDCSKPMSLFDFNYLLAKTAQYTDGHTQIFFVSNASLSPQQQLAIFPRVTFGEDKMVLDEDTIYAINGIPAVNIIGELKQMVSWEYHPVLKQKGMNNGLSVLLYKVYKTAPPFVCKIQKKNDSAQMDSIIPGVKYPDNWSDIDQPTSAPRYKDGLGYDYFSKDSIALLYYNSSYMYDKSYEKSFEDFLEAFFQQIEAMGIKYLFIDISQNGGGSDGAHEYILKHLNTNPYQKTTHIVAASKEGAQRLYEETYRFHTGQEYNKAFSKEKQKQIESDIPWLKYMARPLIENGQKINISGTDRRTMGFGGKVFVIMGPRTYSAGYSFCERIKRGNIGVLVGEECGQRSPFGGNAISDKLPASGISFRFSSTYDWSEPVVPNRDGFLQPDIPYKLNKLLTMEDYKSIIQQSDTLSIPLVCDRQLSVEEMKKDIDYYFETMRKIYPENFGPYSFNQLDSVKAEIISRCNNPLSLNHFHLEMAKVCKYLDVSSSLHFPTIQTLGMVDYAFPYVSFENGHMLLKEDTIYTINGMESGKLVHDLDELVSWEFHPKERERMMNDYLSVLLYRIYESRPPYRCSICEKGNITPKDTILQPVKYIRDNFVTETDKEIYAKRYTEKAIASDIFAEDSIAVLYYNNSSSSDIRPSSNYFFSEIKNKKIKYLFIDVSHLGQGEEQSHEYILNHLKGSGFKAELVCEASKGAALMLKESLFELLGSSNDKKLSKRKLRKLEKEYPEIKVFLPLEKKGIGTLPFENQEQSSGFEGEVFVITGTNTLVSGNLFCERIKRGNMGLLVGEEGGQPVPFGANQTSDNLPESKLSFSLPILKCYYEPPLPYYINGFLQPDIPYGLDKLLEIDDYKEIIQRSYMLKTTDESER